MALNLNKMSIAELNNLISDAQAALAQKQQVAEKVRKLAHDNGLDISDLMAADIPKILMIYWIMIITFNLIPYIALQILLSTN